MSVGQRALSILARAAAALGLARLLRGPAPKNADHMRDIDKQIDAELSARKSMQPPPKQPK